MLNPPRRVWTSLVVAAATAVSTLAADASAVDAVRVVAGTIHRNVTLPGEFLPFLRVDIHAKVAGFVKDVDVDRGSVVKTGQRLGLTAK